jgi:N-acetyl-gamma-glutamyl-phosphate reductase
VSGAGRGAKENLHFGTVDENFTAYGLLTHRHTPEMEQILGAQVLFTPHLAPMVRGILTTCYARPTEELTTASVMEALHDAYDAEPFVVVTEEPPSTKATSGSNVALVTARVDPRTGWVVVLCALDNLVKGASGQAIQCANAALGLAETSGLPVAGVYP